MYSFGRVQLQVIIDSFKNCTLIVVTEERQDPSETSELLSHTYITKKIDHI